MMQSLARISVKQWVIAVLCFFAVACAVVLALPAGHKTVFSPESAARHLGVVSTGAMERAVAYLKKNSSISGFSDSLPSEKAIFHGVDYYHVSESGVVVVANFDYGVLLVVEPSIGPHAILWKCTGYPSTIAERECKTIVRGSENTRQ